MIELDHDLSAPFSAYGYRLESVDNSIDCSGGTPVQLPVFVDAGQELVYTVTFSPTRSGSFNDYLNLSGYILSLSGSTPSGSSVLVPYTPAGWSAPVVVSNKPGTQVDSPALSSTDALYVSWAVLNSGDLSTFGTFYTDLYLDGNFLMRWSYSPSIDPNHYIYLDDYKMGPLGTGSHTLKLIPDSTHVTLGSSTEYTKAFTVGPPSPTFRIVATTMNMSPSLSVFSDCSQISAAKLQTHDTQRVDLQESGVSLGFAIGEGFSLHVVTVNPDGSDGPEINSEISLIGQAPASPPQVNSVLETPPGPLFVDTVLLAFADEPQNFAGVHSGMATLSITTASGVFSVTVQVGSLGYRLGSANNADIHGHDIDGPVFKLADLRGLPPQLVKAVIQGESTFNDMAYRYEPLTVDFEYVSTDWCEAKGSCSAGNLKANPKYLPYVLNSALPTGGANLTAVDSHLRTKYYVTLNSSGRPMESVLGPISGLNTRLIDDGDGPISMENILYTNNKRTRVVPGGWYSAPTDVTVNAFHAERTKLHHPLSPFTAQTVVASSYGLMQVLYPTAVDATYTKNGGAVGSPPDGLFDVNANLDLGTTTLVKKYTRKPPLPMKFAHATDLSYAWCRDLVRYNGKLTYGPDVLSASDTFFPVK